MQAANNHIKMPLQTIVFHLSNKPLQNSLMKFIVLLTIFIATGIIAKAQFLAPGQKVISGTFSIGNAKNLAKSGSTNKNISTNFSTGIKAGKFIKKNVLTSFALSHNYNSSKQISTTNTSKNIANGFSVSYGKTYFKGIAKKLYVGIGGSVGIGYNSSKQSNTQSLDIGKSEGYNIGFAVAPILSYQLTDRFLINCGPTADFFSINYNYAKTSYILNNQTISSGKSQSLNLNTGFFSSPLSNIGFGFSYLLKQR